MSAACFWHITPNYMCPCISLFGCGLPLSWVPAILSSSGRGEEGGGGDADWRMHYHPSVLCLANHDISRIITSATCCQVQSFYECGTDTRGEYDQSQHNSPLAIYHSKYSHIPSSEVSCPVNKNSAYVSVTIIGLRSCVRFHVRYMGKT